MGGVPERNPTIMLRRLQLTHGDFDQRAMQALKALNSTDALHALTTLDDAVKAQGGTARNVGSSANPIPHG